LSSFRFNDDYTIRGLRPVQTRRRWPAQHIDRFNNIGIDIVKPGWSEQIGIPIDEPVLPGLNPGIRCGRIQPYAIHDDNRIIIQRQAVDPTDTNPGWRSDRTGGIGH
jgi:hypothetical protein